MAAEVLANSRPTFGKIAAKSMPKPLLGNAWGEARKRQIVTPVCAPQLHLYRERYRFYDIRVMKSKGISLCHVFLSAYHKTRYLQKRAWCIYMCICAYPYIYMICTYIHTYIFLFQISNFVSIEQPHTRTHNFQTWIVKCVSVAQVHNTHLFKVLNLCDCCANNDYADLEYKKCGRCIFEIWWKMTDLLRRGKPSKSTQVWGFFKGLPPFEWASFVEERWLMAFNRLQAIILPLSKMQNPDTGASKRWSRIKMAE